MHSLSLFTSIGGRTGIEDPMEKPGVCALPGTCKQLDVGQTGQRVGAGASRTHRQGSRCEGHCYCVQAAAEILGRVKGESVAMLVHHSRNSAQKQWDETLVLALGGMGRLLRAHLALLARMPALPQARAWLRLRRPSHVSWQG